MPTLFLFLATSMGRWVAVIAGVAVLVVSWRMHDIAKQRAVGAEKAVARVEKSNAEAIRKARAARAAAQQPKPNGVRDPNTVSD